MADIERIVDRLLAHARRGAPSRHETGTPIGTVRRNNVGTCAAIAGNEVIAITRPAVDTVWPVLFSELRLLFGIGAANAQQLRASGFDSIHSLRDHPRWGHEVRKLLEFWQDPPRVENIHQTMSYWLPASHPLFLMLPALVPPAATCFFDLETLGLFGSPIFLAGIGRANDAGTLHVMQYLARDPGEEPALLHELRHELSTCRFLVTYNGKAFDWTCVRERSAYYALPEPPALLHLDLLPHARRRFRGAFSDVRLETLEQELFGITRIDDLPSAAVPAYYADYLETGAARAITPILNHNRQDVITLAVLYSWLVSNGAG